MSGGRYFPPLSLMARLLTIGIVTLPIMIGYPLESAHAATEMSIEMLNGNTDLVQLNRNNTPPKGFASLTFNDQNWSNASASPCIDATWALPEGGGPWLWASDCSSNAKSITTRRTFIVPSASVLTGRLSLAIHGQGEVFLNGRHIGQSKGNPIVVDVTQYLRPNGAKNILAITANTAPRDTGLGISYNLTMKVQSDLFKRFASTHRGPVLPPPSGLGPNTVAAVSTPQIGTSGQGACTTAGVPGVVQIFTPPGSELPNVTGWVRSINTQHIYIVTRQIDTTRISSPGSLPSVRIAGTNIRANALILEDTTGTEILDLPFNNAAIAALVLNNPQNQAVGQVVTATAYSVTQNCIAQYTATVKKYIDRPDGSRVAQIDTVPFYDGADGGVVFDGSGNFLGALIFDRATLDEKNQVAPLIQPGSTILSQVDRLIAVLNKQQEPFTTEHVLSAPTDGSQSITRIDGKLSPTANSSGSTTATPTATPSATPSP